MAEVSTGWLPGKLHIGEPEGTGAVGLRAANHLSANCQQSLNTLLHVLFPATLDLLVQKPIFIMWNIVGKPVYPGPKALLFPRF